MKKMNNKNYLQVFLIALFQLVLLCGCTSNQDEVKMTLIEMETQSAGHEEMTPVSLLLS